MSSSRYLITGQSGLQIDGILKEFCSTFSTFNERNRPIYHKVEDKMYELYCKEKGLPQEANANVWIKLLQEPISILSNLSHDAFAEILEMIKDETRPVILYCHACFYHLQTLEFIALPSLNLLKQFNLSCIITLIDDIYDIHLRLRQPKQLLAGRIDSAVVMIFDLLKILDWRINEISLSRYFASELNLNDKHYILAVKHSKLTFYDLLFNTPHKPTLYFSHPISQPRRLYENGQTEQSNTIKNEIITISNLLSKHFICFLPTTIDELRIKEVSNPETQKRDSFIYGLKDRWDKRIYDKSNENILYKKPENLGKHRIPFGEDVLESHHTSELLSVLYSTIDRQVSIRDKKLVEQSKVLFVYRPGFDANLSNGVRSEIEYYQLLKDANHDKINCIIYYPIEDQNKLKISILHRILNQNVVGLVEYNLIYESNILNVWNKDDECVNLLQEMIQGNNCSLNIRTGTLSTDYYSEEYNQYSKIIAQAKHESQREIHYYKSKSDLFIENVDKSSPIDIIDQIEIHIKTKI